MDKIFKLLIFDVQNLKNRVIELEKVAHPKREFIACEKCKKEIKEIKNA